MGFGLNVSIVIEAGGVGGFDWEAKEEVIWCVVFEGITGTTRKFILQTIRVFGSLLRQVKCMWIRKNNNQHEVPKEHDILHQLFEDVPEGAKKLEKSNQVQESQPQKQGSDWVKLNEPVVERSFLLICIVCFFPVVNAK